MEDGKKLWVSTGPSEMIGFELGKSKCCNCRRGECLPKQTECKYKGPEAPTCLRSKAGVSED